MTTLSKILLAVAITGLAGGSIIDFCGVTANPEWTAVLPLGAVAFGLFLIVFMLEKEMAEYDKEQQGKKWTLQGNTADPALRKKRNATNNDRSPQKKNTVKILTAA